MFRNEMMNQIETINHGAQEVFAVSKKYFFTSNNLVREFLEELKASFIQNLVFLLAINLNRRHRQFLPHKNQNSYCISTQLEGKLELTPCLDFLRQLFLSVFSFEH